MIQHVLYAAAHADFPDTEPLGGGKAVADYLIREWRENAQIALHVLSPQSVGLVGNSDAAPLAQMSEFQYAHFCREFEARVTERILAHDPAQCVVLANDISEGPDFAALGRQGYRIVTIFHVDVVEYFCKMYLSNLAPAHWLSKFRLFGLMPDVLRLVFQKQFDCVTHSRRLIVPSEPMRDTIRRCYPTCPTERITVLPWGLLSATATITELPDLEIADDEFVILTLSRISPEKGLDRLLDALSEVDPAGRPVRLLICGAPAYMQGQKCYDVLKRKANLVTRVRVEFPGHVTGAMKAALLRRADLFVSPSRHESYGLTIAEAEAAGCRVISHHHYGARGTIVDCGQRRLLARAIEDAVRAGRTEKGVVSVCPSHAAADLAEVLRKVGAG